MEMVPPSIFMSKIDKFLRQQHVVPLKLRQVATQFFFSFFFLNFNPFFLEAEL
jgi:hypothetical protein